LRRDSGCRRRKRLSATLRAGTIESALSTLSAASFSAQARGTMAPHHKAGMRCDPDHMRWLDHEIHHAFGTTTLFTCGSRMRQSARNFAPRVTPATSISPQGRPSLAARQLLLGAGGTSRKFKGSVLRARLRLSCAKNEYIYNG
jgi:hypothetical protein